MDEPALGYGRQEISAADVAAVVRVLQGERLTQGPAVRGFERALCEATGAAHAICVANGSVALHAAHLALGIGPGARVLTTANTFLASAVTAVHCGAEPAFVDVELAGANLDLDALAERLESGERADAVVAVHFAGLSLDMARLLALKRAHGFALIEDAAHALGGSYLADGRAWRVGEHPDVDATILSFHPVKHVTTAEGGAVLVHDDALAARLRRLASHGIDAAASAASEDGAGAWNPTPMIELGFNWRLSDVHAALGTSQLARLDAFLARRRELAARYDAALPEALPGVELPSAGAPERHARHLYWIRVDARDALVEHLAVRGIHAQLHYYPVPDQPWFRARYGAAAVPNARVHARRSLSLPLYPALTDDDQTRVLDALAGFAAVRKGDRA